MMGTLGYVTPVRAFKCGRQTYMQAASGRVAEALAARYEKIYVCARVVHGIPPAPFDSPLHAANLEFIEQPFWATTAGSLFCFWRILRVRANVLARGRSVRSRDVPVHRSAVFLYKSISQADCSLDCRRSGGVIEHGRPEGLDRRSFGSPVFVAGSIVHSLGA
jgi:hypothetical protein